jgi:hypothetical protein
VILSFIGSIRAKYTSKNPIASRASHPNHDWKSTLLSIRGHSENTTSAQRPLEINSGKIGCGCEGNPLEYFSQDCSEPEDDGGGQPMENLPKSGFDLSWQRL